MFFFSMIRRPPSSTLFPTRRSSDLQPLGEAVLVDQPRDRGRERGAVLWRHHQPGAGFLGRSEEHTSELQSRFDLVCRLLLEKKKRIGQRDLSSTARDRGAYPTSYTR